MVELREVKDGLLSSPDKEIMKGRSPELFPNYVQEYFSEKDKVSKKSIEHGIESVRVCTSERRAVFNSELFDYINDLGRVDYYLSRVPVPGEYPYYPLIAKYKFGWVVLSPLEAV